MSEALGNDCLVKLTGGTSGLFNLEETLLSWKAEGFVAHKVWALVPAAAEEVSKYKAACEVAVAVAQHVFLKHKAFSHLPSPKPVEPATLQEWATSGLTLVLPFVEDATGKKFASLFLEPIQHDLDSLFSKGLETVAPIVGKCVRGLLGAGIGKQLRAETMQRIPASHPLREAVDLFLQASI